MKILWIDDEIDLLRAHVRFLEEKGYEVKSAANGEDGIALVSKERFDMLLLDETMPGKGGLETLLEIKGIDPHLPVVMITKNEEEKLMDEAIGLKIHDYLVKPISPVQVYSACRRILAAKLLQESRVSQDYIREFSESEKYIEGGEWQGWIKLHRRLSEWDLEFDRYRGIGLESTHLEQKAAYNQRFSKYIQNAYRDWINSEDRPPMSVDVVPRFTAPLLAGTDPVFLVVIDCVRLDQWIVIEEILQEFFTFERDYYFSILPTATPYARNAIFSGLFPDEMARLYPDRWVERGGDEAGKNRFEEFFLGEQLKRLGFKNIKPRYLKVYTAHESVELRKRLSALLSSRFSALVFNFVDIMAHGRNQIDILQEIAPDESAFRSLMRSWFNHSVLLDLLREISKRKAKVVMTSDHGSVMVKKPSLVQGRRDTSTNLRYKFGDNLTCDEKLAIVTRKPAEYRLPAETRTKTYLFAKEYAYFVYPTNFREYERQYYGSFQHGGVSMEEMIVPCLVLTPK